MLNQKTRIAILFLGWLCAHQMALAASMYSVTGLGILPGGYLTSTATSIDNLGEVAGYSIATNGFNRAFYWTPDGGLVALAGSESNSRAFSVNNGDVVGQIANHAFRWTIGSGIVNLPSFGLPGTELATGVNASGNVVGVDSIFGGTIVTWSPSNQISATAAQFPGVSRVATDNLGEIAGYSASLGFYYDGVSTNVFNLDFFRPSAISDNQILPGQNLEVGSGNVIAGYVDLHANQNLSIGTLSGDAASDALGINPLGTTIVGVSGGNHAFIFDIATNNLQSLTSLLDPGSSGWTILSANSVNDHGQIVGIGEFNGVQQAVLLNPVPEPSTLALFALGGFALCAFRRQSPGSQG